jgi:hypothetical protein
MEGPWRRFRREARARERHRHCAVDSLKVLAPKRPIREVGYINFEKPPPQIILNPAEFIAQPKARWLQGTVPNVAESSDYKTTACQRRLPSTTTETYLPDVNLSH